MAERDQLDDRSLVGRILGGERDLFTVLVSRYEKRIINYVYRITHRYEEAHDLAQEIFVKVYLALDRYDPKYPYRTEQRHRRAAQEIDCRGTALAADDRR